MILSQMLRYITRDTWSIVQSGRNHNTFRVVHINTLTDESPLYIECTKTQDNKVCVSIPLNRMSRFQLFFACEQQAYEYLESYILEISIENFANTHTYSSLISNYSKKRKRGQQMPWDPSLFHPSRRQ